MMRPRHGLRVILVATSPLYFGGTETQWHAADADVIGVSRCVSDDGVLAVVSDLGGNLACGANTGVAAAANKGTTATSHDLEVCAHLGCPLLGRGTRVFILRAIAPDRGFLPAEKRYIARWLWDGSPRAAGDGAAKFCRR